MFAKGAVHFHSILPQHSILPNLKVSYAMVQITMKIFFRTEETTIILHLLYILIYFRGDCGEEMEEVEG